MRNIKLETPLTVVTILTPPFDIEKVKTEAKEKGWIFKEMKPILTPCNDKTNASRLEHFQLSFSLPM